MGLEDDEVVGLRVRRGFRGEEASTAILVLHIQGRERTSGNR